MSGNGEVRSTKGSTEGPWNKDRSMNAKNIRPPKMIAEISPTTGGGSEMKPPDPLAEVLRNSTLNANAQEFVPQWSQRQIPQIPTPEDMSYLVEAIEVLTLSPGRYQEFLPPIEDIVESLLQDKTALAQIIEVIIEQCTIEANFRYTGARMCRDLSNKFGVDFINCLLQRCCEKFGQLPALMDKDRPRVLGFAMLLAELFLQITVDDNSHISHLANGVHQILNMLLAVPAYDTIRTVCQILKLCGVALEGDNTSLQPVFTRLEALADNPEVEENARRIIAGLLHLRRTEWSRQPSEQALTPNQPPSDAYSEPVFYSPDGQIMSEEERSFLLDNIPVSEDLDDYIVDNDMDEEVSEAFEEFVSYSQNNHPTYRS